MQHQQTQILTGGGVVGVSSPFNMTAAYSSSSSSCAQLGMDVEFGIDPASGAIFQTDGRKHDDLKNMLDSNKDGLKLEAMKRIIGMIARGRDAGDLFPAVVKNVVSKNIEVKKLVYVYLVRYAEEQQDLALLSISTFQRALKDPNQLIRASALRVLSSIRVNMIVPIVMLAIRDSASDMSPYVRKTAAHAIPKLYSLDPEQKDELVTVIEKLLSDRTTLVVGSAVMAFDEVCPERVDLIHKNYRKLCNLLVDVDEWGQNIIINMLTRYARTQFVNPNADEPDDGDENGDGGAIQKYNEQFYDVSSSGNESDSVEKLQKKHSNDVNKQRKQNVHHQHQSGSSYHVDLDHRLLLRQTKPLLQSRNASVVMGVAQLYHHIAPRNEVQIIAKALIRLLRSHKEVQSVVLTCIASMSIKRKAIFEPHIKSFFVRTSDPTHIKLLKLDILTNLASASSISLILREFQTYISSSDRSFVAATIQAIGRCAASIKEVTETCLSGLVHLMSNRDEHVVAESVVVIKKLLQSKTAEQFEIISQMAKLIDFINVPAARASIIWLIGEYNEKVPKIAPDVLRKMAKTFVDEEDVVKLQVLNLGVKLYLTNPEKTSLLCQYVFTLARYDPNYDIRDRARFLRQFIFPSNGSTRSILSESAHRVFLSCKPEPALESKHRERDLFQLGSLSHYLNMRATGYTDLPNFPSIAPDSSVRNIEGFMNETMNSGAGSGAGGVAAVSGSVSASTNSSKHHSNAKKNSSKAAKKDRHFLSESEKSSSYSDTSASSSSSSSSSSDSSDSENDDGNDDNNSSSKQKKGGKPVKSTVSEITLVDMPATTSATTTTITTSTPTNPTNNIANDESGTSDSDDSSSYESSSSASSTSAKGGGNSDHHSASQTSDSETDTESETEKKRKFQRAKDKAKQTANEQQQSKLNKKSTNGNDGDAAGASAAARGPRTQTVKSNLDLLLDLDDIPPIGPVMTPSLGGFLTPGTPNAMTLGLLSQHASAERIEPIGPSYIEFNRKELLNKLLGHGLQVSYRFTRSPHLYSSSMITIEMQYTNRSNRDIQSIRIGSYKSLPSGMTLNEFAPIPTIAPEQTAMSILGIDFNDTTRAIEFELLSSAGSSRILIKPPIGELIRSVQISAEYFREERQKLRGMNEHQAQLMLREEETRELTTLKQKIFECVNVAYIPATTATAASPSECDSDEQAKRNFLYFAGQTMSSKSLVLITLDWIKAEKLTLTVNCEKMVIGSMVLHDLQNALNAAFKSLK